MVANDYRLAASLDIVDGKGNAVDLFGRQRHWQFIGREMQSARDKVNNLAAERRFHLLIGLLRLALKLGGYH